MRPQHIERYREERPPRYTPYPSAPHFTAAMDDVLHADWLASIEPKATGSLYPRVPFCRTIC